MCLVTENMKLVRFTINKYFPRFNHDEDIYQIGCLGLVKASRIYDESKGAFSTIATRVIKSSILGYLREARTEKRKAQVEAISFNSSIREHDNLIIGELIGEESFEERVVQEELLKGMLEANLSLCERQLLYMYFFLELSQKQIGIRLGICQPQVSRLLTSAIHKIRRNVC